MKTTKTNLLSAFATLCEQHNLFTNATVAKNHGHSHFASLDYDRFNGGYLPVMVNVETGSISSFLSLSTNDVRLSVAKMYDKLSLLINLSGYVQNNGFGKNIKPEIRLKPTDVITVFARRAFISGNTYHSVLVYVNGDYVGQNDFAYGYESAYEQTAWELLVSKGYKMQTGHEGLRFFGCKVIRNCSDVANRKALKF